ncbi:MAG TPA: T9SS type A sorting domain-containing protein, partial [Fluviicola sp.]|nr:T9SS type A sorting domain-containing protein [Fluviicola sp.]
SLFPNPSEGIVFIASDATQSFDYVVTDANGRLITELSNGVKAGQTTEINLNNMETGVYFIKLSNEQAEKVFRVVIQ